MKRALMWLAFAATLAVPALPSFAQNVRIGFINMVRIEPESKRPHQDAERLKQEFAVREAEMRDLHGQVTALQKQLETLAPDAAAEEINAKRREFGRLAQHFEQTRRTFVEDVERRKAEERQKFLVELRAIVARIAKAQKLDLVVQEAVYASRALDITDAVLKALDRAESGKP